MHNRSTGRKAHFKELLQILIDINVYIGIINSYIVTDALSYLLHVTYSYYYTY